jgi:hypothetical protein
MAELGEPPKQADFSLAVQEHIWSTPEKLVQAVSKQGVFVEMVEHSGK